MHSFYTMSSFDKYNYDVHQSPKSTWNQKTPFAYKKKSYYFLIFLTENGYEMLDFKT